MLRIFFYSALLSGMFLTQSASASTIDVTQLFRLASEQQDPVAQMQLGVLYATGKDSQLGQSDREALSWFTRSAMQGNVLAQYNLGLMFEQGRGAPKSFTEAAHWYTQAANNNHAGAQINLAYLYENGLGIESSKERAAQLYFAAAQSGDPQGQYNYALLQEALLAGRFDAIPWLEKSAQQGYAPAMYSLAIRQLDTDTLRTNAVTWLKKAAEQTHIGAQLLLGQAYTKGLYGVTVSLAQAMYYYNMAVKQNNDDAKVALATIHLESLSRDHEKAIPLLLDAAKNNHAEAKNMITKLVNDLPRHTVKTMVTLRNVPNSAPSFTVAANTILSLTPTKRGGEIFAFEPKTAAFGYFDPTMGNDKNVAIPPDIELELKKTDVIANQASVQDVALTTPKPLLLKSLKDKYKGLKGEEKYQAFTPGKYSVRRGPINIREKASPDSPVTGQLEQGDVVHFIEYHGFGWATINHPETGQIAYIMVRVLDPIE